MGEVLALTDEQSKLVEENHNLIYSFLSSRGLPREEVYDILAIGLCKAAIEWTPSKGAFSTIAYLMMGQEIIRESMLEQRHNVETSLSLDAVLQNNYEDDRVMHQLVTCRKNEYSHCSLALQLQEALPYCTTRELNVLHQLLLETRKVDIAAALNITRKNVHNIVVRIREKIEQRGGPRMYAMDEERALLFRQIERAVSYHVAC